MSRRAGEAVVVAAVAGIALWLRLVHLGTPSIWWDELVEIRTAERPFSSMLDTVRYGIAWGGSAGAMPADYALMNVYLHATRLRTPAHLEAYYRAPACAASVVAVVALYFLGRSLFGRATGALAAWLLALSLPAILYAAEARSYSLFTLATIVDVAAFAGVVRAPHRPARWLVHLVANAFYFLTGIFGLLVIGVQYATLAVLALRGRVSRPPLWAVAASGVALAVVVGRYFAGTPVETVYPRNAIVEPLAMTWASLYFFAANGMTLAVAFIVALPFAVRAGVRRGGGAVAWAIVLAFTALPAIALAIRWKHYYFHGRHVLFLLPLFHLVVAAGTIELVRLVDPLRRLVRTPATRRAVEAVAACTLALGIALPALRGFIAAPHGHFALTKTLRQVGSLTRDLAAHMVTLAPGTPFLLLAERNSSANAVLSAYLDWYGLTRRITLRSPGVPLDQVESILRAHDGDPTALKLRVAHGLFFGFRSLLRLEKPIGEVPSRVSHVGIVGYATPQQGPDVRRYFGVSLRVPAAIAPSPPRS